MNKNNFSYDNFINRELSWLEFNERVLGEAQDSSNPIFERLKFLAIVSSNLDEFFMVRVGSLYDLIQADFNKKDPSGLTPTQQLEKISIRAHNMIDDIYNSYNYSIKSNLKNNGLTFIKENQLSEEQLNFINEYYNKEIYPVLTPMVVDQSRPFPLILNKSINIAVLIKDNEDENIFATVQVPSVLKRFIKLPSDNSYDSYILIEDIIKLNLSTLFRGHEIVAYNLYRITRNADLSIDEEEAEDLLVTIEQSIKQRKWGKVVRLEVEKNIHSELLSILMEEMEITQDQVYYIAGALDLTFLMKLYSVKGYNNLRFENIIPKPSNRFMEFDDIFKSISKKDIILHHPYQSFTPVVDLVKAAAVDENVLAIKQTLYRVSSNSPIVEALVKAAENGKQVTVLVELKARFDEENNINWAKRLEKSGCHVIYGLVGLKTHSKILLIVRREENGIKRYVHLSTGNYNDVTAKIYTDIGLFTANPYIGSDASAFFNMLSGHSEPTELYKLIVAPLDLREKFLKLIRNETNNALVGKKAKIIVKVNSLVDKEIIEALYEASMAGVAIDLIVRGICSLRPKVEGISQNINVISIVGRFLEHSRIYYFYNGGEEKIYLSSADWMGRNLDRRVELMFPIEDKDNKKEIYSILKLSLKDTVKARVMNSDGSYKKISKRNKEIISSQEEFLNKAVLEAEDRVNSNNEIAFKPIYNTIEI